MENKLTLDEQFLTLEQTKELQELGVDFSNANFAFNKVTNDLILLGNGIAENWGYGSKDRMYARTLSVVEMLEMLPDNTEIESVNGYLIYNERLKINGGIYKPLLRDALFEMLKWLKQNKMI